MKRSLRTVQNHGVGANRFRGKALLDKYKKKTHEKDVEGMSSFEVMMEKIMLFICFGTMVFIFLKVIIF